MSKANGSSFEVPIRTARLEFEEWPNLFVRAVLDIPMGAFFDFQRMAASNDPGDQEVVMRRFGDDILLETNITVGGEPIEATGDGFLRLPPAFALEIIQSWVRAIQEVPAPLGTPPSAGEPSGADTTQQRVSL
jgi:hypothetical protein